MRSACWSSPGAATGRSSPAPISGSSPRFAATLRPGSTTKSASIACVVDGDGGRQEIYGIGGSWFRLNADKLIEWQRDFFDFGHVQALYLDLMKAGKLSKGMQKRIERSLAGEKLPGYYPLGKSPVPIW